jgi:acyl-CoA synthetase (AMP-forming)/AMP-acid ligase II
MPDLVDAWMDASVDAWVDAEQRTLPDLLDQRLAEDPDGAFLNCCGTPYTAAELDRESNRIAAGLAEMGVRHDSTVATILENGPAAVLSWFAIHKLGAVAAWRNLWFHTGDIGRIDSDGYLFFVDRKADYLRRRGENISSWEVEKVFHSHPDVQDVCVHAVPSDVGEDDVKVTVVLREGASLTEERLCRWAIDQLPYFAVPRYFEFRGALPLSETGRATKNVLRDQGVTPATWDREAAGVTMERRLWETARGATRSPSAAGTRWSPAPARASGGASP